MASFRRSDSPLPNTPNLKSLEEPPKKGSWLKWVGVFLVLFVLYSGYKAYIIFSAPDPLPPPPPAAPIEPPPARWQRDYNTTFNYVNQVIIIRRVTVSGLNKKKAKIIYEMEVTPRGRSSWIKNKETWAMGAPGIFQYADKVRTRSTGPKQLAAVRFDWPAKQLLTEGAHILLRIPVLTKGGRIRKVTTIRMALEIPPDRKGVGEVQGSGGL